MLKYVYIAGKTISPTDKVIWENTTCVRGRVLIFIIRYVVLLTVQCTVISLCRLLAPDKFYSNH